MTATPIPPQLSLEERLRLADAVHAAVQTVRPAGADPVAFVIAIVRGDVVEGMTNIKADKVLEIVAILEGQMRELALAEMKAKRAVPAQSERAS